MYNADSLFLGEHISSKVSHSPIWCWSRGVTSSATNGFLLRRKTKSTWDLPSALSCVCKAEGTKQNNASKYMLIQLPPWSRMMMMMLYIGTAAINLRMRVSNWRSAQAVKSTTTVIEHTRWRNGEGDSLVIGCFVHFWNAGEGWRDKWRKGDDQEIHLSWSWITFFIWLSASIQKTIVVV